MSAAETVSKSQVKLWLVLGAAFAAGLLCVIVSAELPRAWMQRTVEGIGIALITASILGITIDRALKIELARDVFIAAFRYVVPPALKEELLR